MMKNALAKTFIDRAKEVGVYLREEDPGMVLDNITLTASFQKWSVTTNYDKREYYCNPIYVWTEVLKLLLAVVQNDGGQNDMDMIQGLMLTESR